MKSNFTIAPEAPETEKAISVAKPVEISREKREAFRREMMAKYSKVIAYLGR